MAIDVLCLSEEQRRDLDELLKACQFIVKLKRLNMPGTSETAISFGIDKVAAVLNKIDKVAA